jgi:hypothetical protein
VLKSQEEFHSAPLVALYKAIKTSLSLEETLANEYAVTKKQIAINCSDFMFLVKFGINSYTNIELKQTKNYFYR